MLKPTPKIEEFFFSESERRGLLRKWKERIFKKLRSPEIEFFLKTNDIISTTPLLEGSHEPHMVALYKWCAHQGYKDFFIDIGANIGLSSCPVSEDFDHLYLFEPNPLAFKILEVNTACARQSERFSLFNFGLGSHDTTVKLTIPKHNWGGAFVQNEDNHYSDKILAGKDGFSKIEKSNYIDASVDLKSCEAIMTKIFQEISLRGDRKGFIKIDAEGFEPIILRGIATALPKDMSLYIAFENWDSDFNIHEIEKLFQNRCTSYILKRTVSLRNSYVPPLRPLIYLMGVLFNFEGHRHRMLPLSNEEGTPKGDIILSIHPT